MDVAEGGEEQVEAVVDFQSRIVLDAIQGIAHAPNRSLHGQVPTLSLVDPACGQPRADSLQRPFRQLPFQPKQ
jgi:hypothetical protein